MTKASASVRPILAMDVNIALPCVDSYVHIISVNELGIHLCLKSC